MGKWQREEIDGSEYRVSREWMEVSAERGKREQESTEKD